MMAYKLKSRILARMGRAGEAKVLAREAIRIAGEYAASGPMHERMVLYRPQSWEWMADVASITRDFALERTAMDKAVREWMDLLGTKAAADVPKNLERAELRLGIKTR